MKKTVKFSKWVCKPVFSHYTDGNAVSIHLVDAETKESIAMATVNLPDIPIEEDCVAIKDYSENAGMLNALVEAGIIEPKAERFVPMGFVIIPIHRLTVEAFKVINKPVMFTVTYDDPVEGHTEETLTQERALTKYPWLKNIEIEYPSFVELHLITDDPLTITIKKVRVALNTGCKKDY